jgi:hypothetical protein
VLRSAPLALLAIVTAAIAIASCSGGARSRETVRARPATDDVDAAVVDPVTEEEAGPIVREDLVAPTGPACAHGDACGPDQLCRGPRGCGAPWACGPRPDEGCDGERIAYCDCDGATFHAPSGCAGRPYAHVGACAVGPLAAADELGIHDYDEPPTTEDRLCERNADCRRGEQCYGPPGCGMSWRCQRVRGCGREQAELCSCDGETFRANARCPGRPFLRRGPCDTAIASAGPMDAGVPDATTVIARVERDAGLRTDATTAIAHATPDAGSSAGTGLLASASANEVPPGSRVCSTSRDCRRGEVCTGPPGCGMTWICARPPERCNPDTQVFCDCERNTFRASMNCPGQPFAHRGSCEIDRMLELAGAGVR